MIRDTIKTALVSAMKGGDKAGTSTIRLIQSAIKNRDIELRTGTAPADDDAMITEVLQKMIKQRRELVTMYRQGNREELAAAGRIRDRGDRTLPPGAALRRGSLGQDRRDRVRARRLEHEGHGPRDGGGEGAPGHEHRTGPGECAGEGGVGANPPLPLAGRMGGGHVYLSTSRLREGPGEAPVDTHRYTTGDRSPPPLAIH